MTPEDVLTRCRPDPRFPVFAIGVTESGVTVASQQVRALHLVDALVRCDKLAAGSHLAVVGAGAAGLTAAARAARIGCQVTIFERDREVLPTIRGSDRLLHPNLYRWPHPDWLVRKARVPILPWEAGPARRVAHTIERAFRDELRSGLIDLRTGVAIGAMDSWVQRSGRFEGVTLGPHGGDERTTFAAVILAVGFGRERRTGERFPGYWTSDWVSHASGSSSPRYLIQGAGDGGLTDLLRLRLGLFDQDTFFQELLPDGDPLVKTLKAKVEGIESRAREALKMASDRESIEHIDAEMDAAYRSLDAAWLDDRLAASGLRPNSVVLCDKRPAFGHGRFSLNKLLASRLVKHRRFNVEWVHRELPDIPDRDGPIEVDIGDGGPPRRFDRVLLRLGSEAAIDQLGDKIAQECRDMVKRGSDPALVEVPAEPPAATGQRALATAIRYGQRILDLIRTLMLFLRYEGRRTSDLIEDRGFERLRVVAYEAISQCPVVATDTATDVARVAAAFIMQCPEVDSRLQVDVAARALAEALELRWRDHLRRTFRGPAGTRHRAEYGPNCVCPRERAFDDATEDGVATVALMPPGRAKLQIEWTTTVWPSRLRIAAACLFGSIEDLEMTQIGRNDEVIEFFGVAARDRENHAERLNDLTRRLLTRSFDLVVLPEFALHTGPSWASAMSTRSGSIVFSGCGHIDIGGDKVHRSVIAFTDSTVLLRKTAASTYVRGTERWREDIHAAPSTLFAVADGHRLVALATEDALDSEDLLDVLKTLRPQPLVISGASGTAVRQRCKQLGLTWLLARFGRPARSDEGRTRFQMFEIITLYD